MAKAKAGARKAPAASKKTLKLGLIKNASKKMAKAAARVVKAATKLAKAASVAKAMPPKVAALKAVAPVVKAALPKAFAVKKGAQSAEAAKLSFQAPVPDKPLPRASKLPASGEPLTKREMEQLLTAGAGRGVEGEGSLKGRLRVKDGFPFLAIIGRDKRELVFLLQGPDQEVLPAYADHKVSVSGLIKKTTNYGGTVDVRKYSAKKPEAEAAPPPPVEVKLKYLSPGEIEQLCAAGMGAGMRGFATMRGHLEMTGDDFFLVTSNGGTRQQVSFLLQGKGAKGLRKFVGQVVQVTGVVDKTAGWGGTVQVEIHEPRPSEHRAVSREAMAISKVEGASAGAAAELVVNNGLAVKLLERAGYTWAIEPTVAKRIGLREANFVASSHGPATREFFFTPRTPGVFEVEFFLAKAFMPSQVSKTYKLTVSVRP